MQDTGLMFNRILSTSWQPLKELHGSLAGTSENLRDLMRPTRHYIVIGGSDMNMHLWKKSGEGWAEEPRRAGAARLGVETEAWGLQAEEPKTHDDGDDDDKGGDGAPA